MRTHVLAGEVAAIMNADSKTSPWAVWNRMTQEHDRTEIDERGRWQARLAYEIAYGICEDRGINLLKPAKRRSDTGIIPPSAFLIAPSQETGGQDAILIVTQRTSQMMFGWKAPNQLPEKQVLRLYASAIAYGVRHVMLGVLVDGYHSQLYRFDLDPDIELRIKDAVFEMQRAVREDDEPVVDYDLDRDAIRSGAKVSKAEKSTVQINALIDEHAELTAQVNALKSQAKPAEDRRDTIETMLIDALQATGTIDLGARLVSIEEKRGKKVIKVTQKALKAEDLF